MTAKPFKKLDPNGKPMRRKDGSTIWCVEYRDAAGKRITKATFRTEKEASIFLEETGVDVRKGVHTPDKDSITVAEAAELWIEARRADRDAGHLEPSSFKKYEQHARLHIVPRIGGIKLSQLRRPDVVDLLDRVGREASPAMALRVRKDLSAILNHAMDMGRVAQNVAAMVRQKRSKKVARERAVSTRWRPGRDYPTAAEVAQMLTLAQNPPEGVTWGKHGWPALLATVAETGARISELRGLPWAMVDLDNCTISIEQRADEDGQIGAPKTETSVRTIDITPTLAAILTEWRKAQPDGARRGGLVWATGTGRPDSYQNITSRFLDPLQIALGLVELDALGEPVPQKRKIGGKDVERSAPRYGWHAFRHYVASKLIYQGWDVVRVADFLGHSDANTTLRYYAHMFDEAQRRRHRGPPNGPEAAMSPEIPQKNYLKLAVSNE